MRTPAIIILSFLTGLFSCDTPTQKKSDEKAASQIDTSQQDSSSSINQIEEIVKTIPENTVPVFGYRFTISGDFNGDGKRENLTEHFFSALDNKETNKFYNGLSDYDQLVALTIKKDPVSFVSSDSKLVDTLHIHSGGQLLGLSYLKNEGDLNGDGTDEVSYVVNWADWSNLNTWHLMTYQNHGWTKLYSFAIWDWQLPDLPETFNQYGLFGLENKIVSHTNDSTNLQTEKEWKDFKGLIKKIAPNKIQIIFRNEEANEDSMIVDLKPLQPAI